MNKILIPVMVMAALTFVIVDATNKAQAQSVFDIPEMNAITNHVNSITAKIDIVTLIMNACTAEFDNLDACVKFFDRVDRHMTIAIKESNADIQKIMGFELP
jgi:hypothetical protein